MADRHGIVASVEIDGAPFDVVEARIREALDEIPRLELRLARDGALPAPRTLVGSEASFTVGRDDLLVPPRPFRGDVVKAERRADATGRPYLRVVVEPRLYRLRHRTDCRSFRTGESTKKDALQLVAEVLSGAGVPAADTSRVTASLEKHEWRVQYRETDLDFVLRLLAEEGIALAWDHEANAPVLFDDAEALGDATEAEVPYRPDFGFDQPFATVGGVTTEERVVTDKVTLRGHDFERPRHPLEATVEGKDPGGHALEAYVYGARTEVDAELARFAQVTLDALQSRRSFVRGSTTAWSLRPGQRFRIVDHPISALGGGPLLVTSVSLRFADVRSAVDGSRHAMSIHFEAIPTASSTYRPARRPRGREVPGTQLAFTTGPSGEEIHTDAHGRVKVRFPWDRNAAPDDASSDWMRTAQAPTGGSMLLPRVGWEVLVASEEGDVDDPYVLGRLYNAQKTPPYALPAGRARSALQTATTPGGGSTNELRTDDTGGSEEMFLNASKDMSIKVLNNTTESIANDAKLEIGSNHTVEITNSSDASVGSNQSTSVGGNQTVKVSTFLVDDVAGDHSLTIGGNRDMKVGGDHKFTIGGSETIDVGAMRADLVVGKVSETVGGSVKLDVGAAEVAITAGDATLEMGGSHSETIGAAHLVLSVDGVGTEITGTMMQQVAGVIAAKIDGDRAEEAGATFTSVAAGAQIVKADNVVFEADTLLSFVMGASTIILTPASVSITGISVKLDGATAETSALILDN